MSQFLALVRLTAISLFTVAAGVSLGLALLIVSAPIEHKLTLTSSIIDPNVKPSPNPLYASLIAIDTIAKPEAALQNTNVEEEDDDDDSDCS